MLVFKYYEHFFSQFTHFVELAVRAVLNAKENHMNIIIILTLHTS